MKHSPRFRRRIDFTGRLLLATAFLGLSPLIASAQFEDIDEAQQAEKKRGRGNFQVAASTFDQWVFGGQGKRGEHRKRLESMVSLKIDALDSACELSPEQEAKLRLAARGDIKRFEEMVAIARKKFEVARLDQQEFNNIWQQIQPLQQKVQQGILDEASLFHRVVDNTLTENQLAKFEEVDLERRTFAYHAQIGMMIDTLQKSIPMRHSQRETFDKLLREETKVPRKIHGQYAFYVVLINAANLPEDKLEGIFDPAQLRALKKYIGQYKGMEQHLEKNGFL